MRVFIKCPFCGFVLYTKHTPFVDVLTKKSVKCNRCGLILDCISIFMCNKPYDDDYCDSCDFRFKCFTSIPIEEEGLTKIDLCGIIGIDE